MNVAAAKVAEELFQLCRDESGFGDVPRFWERMRELVDEVRPIDVRPPTRESSRMGAIEAHEWARRASFPRGMYVGRTVSETPIEYCDWWNENRGDDFDHGLAAYLRSTEADARRERETSQHFA